MRYSVRAYESRAAGESGRFTPLDRFQTGDSRTAEHGARQLADGYGAAVIEDTETGSRTWLTRR
jgi:hypothetical protein